MKTITVLLKYQAEIPDDMETDDFQELAQRKAEQKMEDFRLMVESYLDINEEEAEPYFELKDVMVGETIMIAIG